MLLLSAVPGLPREISANLSPEEKDLEPRAVFWGYGKKKKNQNAGDGPGPFRVEFWD